MSRQSWKHKLVLKDIFLIWIGEKKKLVECVGLLLHKITLTVHMLLSVSPGNGG